jgi:hypothetical protein
MLSTASVRAHALASSTYSAAFTTVAVAVNFFTQPYTATAMPNNSLANPVGMGKSGGRLGNG